MNICIVIPAHNEEKYLTQCLQSFIAQSRKPDELIIVDDNSTDDTFNIASKFDQEHHWIRAVQKQSTDQHLPGQKVVEAFNYGLSKASIEYDLIGKFDADIILPANYFEQMQNHFQANWLLGICSGLLYVEKNGQWVYENIAKKSHIRGPIKLYHRQAFELMGGLRLGTGWDTVDTLLCQYHDFEVKTDTALVVKHLRPTGHGYSTKNYQAKGEALYKMRYGLPIAKLALLKMAWQAKNLTIYVQGIFGYLKAFFKQSPRYVSKQEGKFIRRLRWNGILGKPT